VASPLEAPIDLALASILEPGPGLLVVTSQMTPARQALAAVFALGCAALLYQAWRSRSEGWAAVILPYGMLAPVFLAVAAVLAFGRQQKSFHRGGAEITGGLGPLAGRLDYDLPPAGTIRVTFQKETRRYDVNLEGFPALGFTTAGEPAPARALAAKLGAALSYRVEDDSVEPPK
jgi:hypothetical protein